MTTDIRDGVVWKPWWVRYAEFGGRHIVLIDWEASDERYWKRYHICDAPETNRCWKPGDDLTPVFDDLDEALAAFHEAEEKLLRGEL